MAVDPDPNERTVVERHDPLIGALFDRRFQVEARLAAGGFGAIYRATHIKSGHEFALKVLHGNLTSDPRVVARFRREGATLTRLRDPHTITAYELGEAEDGTLYIVMELLHGESLYDRYRAHGAMPWQRVVAIARAVCSSLAEAHALGVIHRDLKPTNIHLEDRAGDTELVKVLDFGIAKILQDSDIEDSSDLTHAGQMVGTLDYMSPEQMVGGMCTAASDIYTLGIVMYEMIAGKKPFDNANSAAAALAAVLTATPERLSVHALIPAQLDHLVMRCLERQHADRYQTALELAEALDELLPVGDEAPTTAAMTTVVAAITTLPGTMAPGHVTPAPRLPPPVASPFVSTLPLPMRRASTPNLTRRDPTPPVARRIAPAARPGSRTAPAIDHDATPIDHSTTVLGHLPARSPIAARPIAAPLAAPAQAATPQAPSSNLREVYPTIHRPPPSPMRPAPSQFDDRPGSSVSMAPFGMSSTTRRDTVMRRLVLGIALAIAVLAAMLIASRW